MVAMKLYPDAIARLFEHSAAVTARKGKVIARLIREGRHPKAFLCGKDLCGQNGPLVDPGFLRERWFPLVHEALVPLKGAGAEVVWHCDGDVRSVLDDILNLGVGGLQGFQTETGLRLEEIVERRTVEGKHLIVFGPISVTTTLVRETPEGVKAAVRRAVKLCQGKAHLALMTSNVIGPDVPLENVFAMYDALDEL